VNDPLLVLADEPTGDLDSENAEEVLSLMAL
jgi:ABC-type lipoprotein export system ATPase subunit